MMFRRALQPIVTWAEDRATQRCDSSADPGAESEERAAVQHAAVRPSSLRSWHQSDKPSRHEAATVPAGCPLPLANADRSKFHFTVNGKDLALTPFHIWAQKSTGADSTSTCIDMKSDDGRIYDIDFVTTGPQVTSIKIHKINGESLR